MLHGYVLIAIRAVTGTAAAIPMLLLISAKMIPVVADNNAAVLGFCFLAGFSERWFLAVLKPLTDGKNKNS
jgi:hypothetical protein